MSQDEYLLFLKAMKEDGIEHVYAEKQRKEKCHCEEPQRGDVAISPKKNEMASPSARGDSSEISALCAKVQKCKLCSDLARTRNKIVFGAGDVHAKLVFVGEAPGADEDRQGLPFVGRAGQLLTKIIEAMGMTRDQVFICNVLKCRPPNNRPPAPEEVMNCRPFLKRQIELIRPKVIVALGNHAARALLQTEKGISTMRGTFQTYEGLPVMCTYHPAYLLRSPGEKRKVWEDMKKVMHLLKGSEG